MKRPGRMHGLLARLRAFWARHRRAKAPVDQLVAHGIWRRLTPADEGIPDRHPSLRERRAAQRARNRW